MLSSSSVLSSCAGPCSRPVAVPQRGGATAIATTARSHHPSATNTHHQQQQSSCCLLAPSPHMVAPFTPPRHRRHAVAVSASAAGRFGTTSGPNGFRTLPVLNVPLGPSPTDPSMPLELQMEVMVPEVSCACPVVFWTPGFLLNSSLYRSYAARLASWGYTVVLWDLSEVLDDTLTCAFMKQAIEQCSKDRRLSPYCNTQQLILMGHSRGAKLSCLIAEQDPRVQGLVLVDPVDNSSFGPQGVGYPSSLPSLSAAASVRQLPVLVVGAAMNTDVVPAEGNWKRFTAAAVSGGSPVWEVVLRGSAHLQFLDKQQPLFSLFSNNGPTPDDVVRQITQTAIVSFMQLAVCPAQPYSSTQVQTLLAEEAGTLQRLAPLDSTFKNFSQLRTSSVGNSTGTAADSSSSSSSSRAGAPPPPPPPPPRQQQAGARGGASSPSRVKPVQASYEQLMGMRAGELKRLLQEHGVSHSDCFEKQELVVRILERCTAPAQA